MALMPTTEKMQAIYMQFWGKAGGERPGEPGWHPLAYHALDVAAVADFLLRRQQRMSQGLARLLGTTPENARCLLVALVALHDVGKFSAAFQSKSEAANRPAFYLGHKNIRNTALHAHQRARAASGCWMSCKPPAS